MMIGSVGIWQDVHTWLPRTLLIPFVFTTDGSNEPTLAYSYGGRVTIARSTNTYTITLPTWKHTGAVSVDHSLAATLNITKTVTPSAGTIVLAFSGAFTSARCDITLTVCEETP